MCSREGGIVIRYSFKGVHVHIVVIPICANALLKTMSCHPNPPFVRLSPRSELVGFLPQIPPTPCPNHHPEPIPPNLRPRCQRPSHLTALGLPIASAPFPCPLSTVSLLHTKEVPVYPGSPTGPSALCKAL